MPDHHSIVAGALHGAEVRRSIRPFHDVATQLRANAQWAILRHRHNARPAPDLTPRRRAVRLDWLARERDFAARCLAAARDVEAGTWPGDAIVQRGISGSVSVWY